jgi:uncharacterized membrane protein YGL010W
MDRKFAISVVVLFVVLWAISFVVHGVLLNADYAQLPNLMRPMSEFARLWPFMALAFFSTALAFTWIYSKGKENKPWLAQGVRFGIAVALLAAIPMYLIYYVVMPFPFGLVIKQIVFDTIGMVIAGVVVAWLYR